LYERRLFGLALMMIHDRAGAEDVVQEAFVRAYTKLERYDEYREFYPWLATIAVRLAQDRISRQGRTTAGDGTALSAETDADSGSDLLGELIADERGRRLWNSVATLPRGERMAVLLYYRQELQITDIATVLGVTSGTVKTMLFRARKKLRAMMNDGATDTRRS
jgi:RNA polymerase sigma-70 factor (ECF subfamily)